MTKKKEHKHDSHHDHKRTPEEIYTQLQLFESQINHIAQELQMLDARKQEVDALIESVDNLKNTKDNSDAYAPLGPGVFVKSQIKDTKHLLVNVGAGVIVKKDIESAKKILAEQSKNLEDAQKKLNNALQIYYLQAQAMQAELYEGHK